MQILSAEADRAVGFGYVFGAVGVYLTALTDRLHLRYSSIHRGITELFSVMHSPGVWNISRVNADTGGNSAGNDVRTIQRPARALRRGADSGADSSS